MDPQSRSSGRSRLEEAGRRLDEKLSEAERRIQSELSEIVTFLDKEVVPNVRRHSSRTLRSVAEKLSRLADSMDKNAPPKP